MNFAVLDNFFLEWIFFFSGCSSQGAPSSTGCVQVMLAPVEVFPLAFPEFRGRNPSFRGYFCWVSEVVSSGAELEQTHEKTTCFYSSDESSLPPVLWEEQRMLNRGLS